LKTGFTAEAASAARFRAYATRAERDGLNNLAGRWRDLAEAKDQLAVRLLEASEQVLGGEADVVGAISEERYENDVLYPKMLRDLEGSAAEALGGVVADQKGHLGLLEALRKELGASQGDVR
jgi:rubrerythrin